MCEIWAWSLFLAHREDSLAPLLLALLPIVSHGQIEMRRARILPGELPAPSAAQSKAGLRAEEVSHELRECLGIVVAGDDDAGLLQLVD